MKAVTVREAGVDDQVGWRELWNGYNAFYGRTGDKALPEVVTRTLWERLADPREPLRALVADNGGRLCGLAHLVFHRSTSSESDVCYLQDLFVSSEARRRGVGKALLHAVCDLAQMQGCGRVYWHTQDANRVARRLYDQIARRTSFVVYRREF